MSDEGTELGNGLDPAAALAKLVAAKGDPSALTPDALRAGVQALGFDPSTLASMLAGNSNGGVSAGGVSAGGVSTVGAPPAASLPIGAVMEPGGGIAAPGLANPNRAAGAAAIRKRKKGDEKKDKAVRVDQFLNKAGGIIGQVMAQAFGEMPVIVDIRAMPEGVAVAISLPEDEEDAEERLYAAQAPGGRLGDLFLHVINESCAILDSAADDEESGKHVKGEDDDEG